MLVTLAIVIFLGKKTAIIKARKTWESTSEDEDQILSSTIRIVISTTME